MRVHSRVAKRRERERLRASARLRAAPQGGDPKGRPAGWRSPAGRREATPEGPPEGRLRAEPAAMGCCCWPRLFEWPKPLRGDARVRGRQQQPTAAGPCPHGGPGRPGGRGGQRRSPPDRPMDGEGGSKGPPRGGGGGAHATPAMRPMPTTPTPKISPRSGPQLATLVAGPAVVRSRPRWTSRNGREARPRVMLCPGMTIARGRRSPRAMVCDGSRFPRRSPLQWSPSRVANARGELPGRSMVRPAPCASYCPPARQASCPPAIQLRPSLPLYYPLIAP